MSKKVEVKLSQLLLIKKMFSFEHENIIPDIFTVSKSLGGGKSSIAAYITKDKIYNKAYGDLKNYMIHSTTFNGFGEECYTAIEAINIIIDENLNLASCHGCTTISETSCEYFNQGLDRSMIIEDGLGYFSSLMPSQ